MIPEFKERRRMPSLNMRTVKLAESLGVGRLLVQETPMIINNIEIMINKCLNLSIITS